MPRKIVIILLVFGLLAGGTYYFLFSEEEKAAFDLITVTTGDVTEKALAIGEIAPRTEIQVKSKIGGIVKRRFVEIGDAVQAGQALVDITPDPTPLEITEARKNVQIAQVSYNQAKNSYERRRELFDRSLISRSEFEQDEQLYEEEKLRLGLQKERLSLLQKGRAGGPDSQVLSQVRSPIAGTVLERFVDRGDPVVPLTSYQAGTPLFSLADMSHLLLRGSIDEIDVGKVRVGMPVELKIGALPGEIVNGQVLRISPKAKKVDNATQFDIEISIDADNQVPLRAGYSANADILISQANDVTRIAERFVNYRNDSTFVEVFDTTTQHISERAVQLGLSDGVHVEVLDGLASGEQLVERPPMEIQ
jgi:HlyD family secretion protein